MVSFILLEHTADVGVELRAATFAGLLQAACRSLPALLGIDHPGTDEHRPLEVCGDSHEELLVNWFNELLYHLASEDFVAADAEILTEGPGRITGILQGSSHRDLPPDREIKAATWHQLAVVKEDDGWRGRVFLDL